MGTPDTSPAPEALELYAAVNGAVILGVGGVRRAFELGQVEACYMEGLRAMVPEEMLVGLEPCVLPGVARWTMEEWTTAADRFVRDRDANKCRGRIREIYEAVEVGKVRKEFAGAVELACIARAFYKTHKRSPKQMTVVMQSGMPAGCYTGWFDGHPAEVIPILSYSGIVVMHAAYSLYVVPPEYREKFETWMKTREAPEWLRKMLE